MWLATKCGFFSIVEAQGKDLFMVRARAKKDLETLKKEVTFLKSRKIKEYENTDYPVRVFISSEELEKLMVYFAKSLDYSNFKDKIKEIPKQKDKLPYYNSIWGTMYDYQFRNEHKMFPNEENFGNYWPDN